MYLFVIEVCLAHQKRWALQPLSHSSWTLLKMMFTQAGTFCWWEKSQQGWILTTFAGREREQHSSWVPPNSCGEFVGSDFLACNCDFEWQHLDESKWVWQAAAQKRFTRAKQTPGSVARCLPALLRAQMWRLVYFALTEALEILPWRVSAERCP